MKKILLILLVTVSFISCKSNEEKIQDLIQEQMYQTLYDYKSYEPIETVDMQEEIHTLHNDSGIIVLAKEYAEGVKKIESTNTNLYNRIEKIHNLDNKTEEVFNKVLDSRSNILFLLNEMDKPYGYSVIHRFRAKNKGGVYNIYTKKYLIDKSFKRIIWEYTIDEKDKMQEYISYFIDKWNNSKIIKQENIKFLENNKNKEGIITTNSGLQYRIIRQGKGAVPTETSNVKIHYIGKLTNGTEFDNSYKRKAPAALRVNAVIKGMTEALTLMSVGSKWEIYVPHELGYGSRELGIIKPYSILVFEIELLSIEK